MRPRRVQIAPTHDAQFAGRGAGEQPQEKSGRGGKDGVTVLSTPDLLNKEPYNERPDTYTFGIPQALRLMNRHQPERQQALVKQLAESKKTPDANIEHCDFPADSLRFPSYLLSASDLDVLERYGEEPDLRLNWWKARLVPSYGHRLSMLSHLALPLVPRADAIPAVDERQEERFWLEERTPPREKFEYLRERFSRLPPENLSVARRPGEALAEMLDLLRRHDVPTVVVIAPRSPTYRERATPEGIANTIQRIAAISEKHGTGFVNAFRWLDDDIWFSDCVHITETGADLFTRRLTEEVIRPELASTRTGKGSVASR